MAKADHFESKLLGGSVTRECRRGECNKAGRKIVLVDTPGLFDTQFSFEQEKKAAKVRDLIQFVESIVKEHGGNCYINEMYKEAQAALLRIMKEVEEKKAREKKKDIDQMQSKFNHQIDSIKKDNKKLAKEISSNQMAQRQFKQKKERAQQETIRMREEIKKIDKKINEEIYLIKKKEQEEKEKQARDLEKEERQHLQLLQSMQQQQAETSRRYQDMERQKELQLLKVTAYHHKRMEAEIRNSLITKEKYETYTKPIVKDECEPAESRNTSSSDKTALPKRPPPPSRPLRSQLEEKVQIRNDDDIKQMASLYGRREENEIRLVMVGRTGSGKSATGNTIMAKADHFESKLAGGSVTRECKRGECDKAGRKIVLVDTPGLCDTQVPFEQMSKEIIRCVNMSTPGPHAFLLVIQIARITDEEIEMCNRLFDLFGDGIGKFVIITFTKLDGLEREQTTIDEYIAMAPQKLKDFIKCCQGRYLAIDNKASEKKKAAKVRNLLQLVDGIVNENRGNYYTNEMYKEAEAALQRKIKEVEEEKAREKQKEIDQIQSKFTHQIDSIKKDNKKLAKEVSSNQMAQRQFQQKKEKAQQETIRMKEEIKKIDMKRNAEIYHIHLIMTKEKGEKEKQARDLKQKERQHLQLLQSMQQQQAETSRRYQDMERQKELQLSKVTEDHYKRMEAEIQRIVDGSDEKYKHMMQTLEAKDKSYEKLQEQMAQQNSKMQELMRQKDKDFIKQQEENRKRIEQEKNRSNDIILLEQKERDQIQREEYRELKGQYKRTQEQM